MKKVIFTIVILSICNAFAGDLVLYLPFEKASGTTIKDQSGFANDANFNVQPIWVDGPFGRAAEFDGATWGEVLGSESINLTKALTISAWVLTTSDQKQIIVEKAPTWNRDGEYALLFYENRIPVIQARDLPNDCDDEVLGEEIPKNEWRFVAGTWDGAIFKLYINAVLSAEMECAGELLEGNEILYIGSRGAGLRFMQGALDEIRIYNFALSEKEIRRDMDGGLAVEVIGKMTTSWGELKRRF